MTAYTPITYTPNPDSDDAIADAVAACVAAHPALRGWDLDADWLDDQRERVYLVVPDWALDDILSHVESVAVYA
jgi:hypothetical protein